MNWSEARKRFDCLQLQSRPIRRRIEYPLAFSVNSLSCRRLNVCSVLINCYTYCFFACHLYIFSWSSITVFCTRKQFFCNLVGLFLKTVFVNSSLFLGTKTNTERSDYRNQFLEQVFANYTQLK